MRSQALLAQKPKRVGLLANVGAKVRNKNETAKLFGNFLTVCIILWWLLLIWVGIEPLQFYPISYKCKRIFQQTLHPSLFPHKSLAFNKLLEWRVVLTLHHPSLPFTGSILRVRSSGRSSTPTTIKDYRKTINFCNPQKLDFNAVKGSEGWWRVETTLHPYKTLTLNNLNSKSEGWRVFGFSAI